MFMLPYLVRSSVETIRADGWRVFFEEALRYLRLYGSPLRTIRYRWNRLIGEVSPIVIIQGSYMQLDLRDGGIHADLFMSGIREPQATRYSQSIIRPSWVVADVGANIGYYALQEARIARKVIAIEPSPANFTRLEENIALNHYRNITTHRLAIGSEIGSVSFHIATNCNQSKIASRKDRVDIEVPMLTLDSFLQDERIDFLRMDVEGYEYNILQGADETLKRWRPRIFVEVHRDLLKDYGHTQLELMGLLGNRHDYWIEKSYISAREGPTGRIRDLLRNPVTRRAITERGIASHIFFAGGPTG